MYLQRPQNPLRTLNYYWIFYLLRRVCHVAVRLLRCASHYLAHSRSCLASHTSLSRYSSRGFLPSRYSSRRFLPSRYSPRNSSTSTIRLPVTWHRPTGSTPRHVIRHTIRRRLRSRYSSRSLSMFTVTGVTLPVTYHRPTGSTPCHVIRYMHGLHCVTCPGKECSVQV